MVSYKRLFKLLIDRDMKKGDLERTADISHYVMHKLNLGQNVTTDVNCAPDDIMDIFSEEVEQ